MNRPFIETLPKKAKRGRNRGEIRDLAELRVQPCGPLHPCSYWIVIKRSRASDRAHCPVIHSSSPDYFSLCVSTRRRKKNKPPLIHVYLPHDYVKRQVLSQDQRSARLCLFSERIGGSFLFDFMKLLRSWHKGIKTEGEFEMDDRNVSCEDRFTLSFILEIYRVRCLLLIPWKKDNVLQFDHAWQ